MSRFKVLLGLAVLSLRVSALQVTPGSSCSAVCLNDTESDPLDPESSNTDISQITCHDEEYDSTSTGIKYRNCLDCLQKSNATHEVESDAEWYLYNLRYSVDICVYGFPNDSKRVSSPCDIDTACEPLKKAMEAGDLNPNRGQYEYCTADADSFSGHGLDPCIQCLSTSSDLSFMANFMTALKAGCDQRPKGGQLLGLAGSLFSTARINVTDPPSNQTLTGSGDNSGAMTQGTIVGIAVGAALLFLGGIGLFWVYHRKQKRLYGVEKIHSDYDPRGGSKSTTPPLVGGFAGPQKLAAMTQVGEYELRSQQPLSSYYPNRNAEYYDALEKEMFNLQPAGATVTTITSAANNNHNNNYNPNTNNHQYAFSSTTHASGSGGLPTHPAYDPRATHSRQSSRHSQTPTPTPEPPRPARTNTNKSKPDSYALRAYLSAAEDADSLRLPGPPPGPPPPAAIARVPSSSSSSRAPPESRGSGNNPPAAQQPQPQPQQSQPELQQQQQQHQAQPHIRAAPPPPPPRTPKTPTLRLPSVPRIRVPKKYAPPQISVEEPTPVDDSDSNSNSNGGGGSARVLDGDLSFAARRQRRQQ